MQYLIVKALRVFSDHPASMGENYVEHMGQAFGFAGRMFLASLACFLHGLLPFLFVRTGSTTIAELHDRMVINRNRSRASSKVLNIREMR